MKNGELEDLRGIYLRWILPFVLGLLSISLVLLLLVTPPGAYERQAYTFLIGVMAIFSVFAYYFNKKGKYNFSSVLTLLIALIGAWGSIIIDFQDGFQSFFPLVYLTVPVAFSSLLFPVIFTVVLSATQFIVLIIVVFSSPQLLANDWESFLAYVLIVSVLSIVANYIIRLQLKQFKESSITDHLTGLFNRRYFEETLASKIRRKTLKDPDFGVVLIDIDRFKSYNDNYGHNTGDLLLALMGQFLLENVGLHDIVCRYGGDEFVLLITNTTLEKLYEFAERLRVTIKSDGRTQLDPRFNQVTLSMGLAMFPQQGESSDALMAQADKNLLKAKELGKDKVVISD